jgi:hypothetical protein
LVSARARYVIIATERPVREVGPMKCVACYLSKSVESVADWLVEGTTLCTPCFKILASVTDASLLPARTVRLVATITQARGS